jgi:hypothetical protein
MDTSLTHSDNNSDRSMDRLSVVQAADVLGVTQAAVYKRIQRGTIAHDKDPEGRVFVYLDDSDIPTDKSTDTSHRSTDKSKDGSDASTDRSMDGSNSGDLIDELRAHNEHLRLEVEAWREESRRKDAILMTMAQRIPELEAATEPRERSEQPSEERGDTDTPSGKEEFPQQHRSWLRRFFFGP